MITRIFMSLLAVFFPWLILFLQDNPGGALVALVMQASVVGWPFASAWAWRSLREVRKAQAEEKRKAKELAQKEKAEAKEKKEQARREKQASKTE